MARTKKPIVVEIPEALRPHLVPVASIKLDPRNPKKTKQRGLNGLQRSLRDLGCHRLIVCNTTTRMIVVGARQYEAMLALGQPEVPVLFVDETDAASLKRNIIDQRSGETTSSWDFDILDILMEEIELDLADYLMDWPEEKDPDEGRTTFVVEVEVKSEDAQDALVLELDGRGYTCRGTTKKIKPKG